MSAQTTPSKAHGSTWSGTCAGPASCDCWREAGALLPAPAVLPDCVLLDRMRSASMCAVTAARASDMAVLICGRELAAVSSGRCGI